MHWMLDWGTPFPIHVASAKGSRLDDVDGHSYDDFCFGDTGSMFADTQCHSCHVAHGEKDSVFVQFYPLLRAGD